LFTGFSLSAVLAIILQEPWKTKTSGLQQDAAEIWRHARWLMGSTIIQWISGNAFLLAAGGILGTLALGAVKMALNLMGFFNVFFQALENKVPVSASYLFYHKGKREMYYYLKKVTLTGLLVTLLIIVLISGFAEKIIHLTYGEAYIQYAYVVVAFGLMQLLIFFGMPFRFAIRTLNMTKDIFYAYLLTASFGLLLAVPLVKSFGIIGVIIGLVSSQLIVISWLSLKIQLKWKKI
jgi:O-antigen/teichoic acid export membrane protein